MCKGGRIDDDECSSIVSGGMNTLDQLVFRIALQAVEVVTGSTGLFAQLLVDLVQGGGAVHTGFAGTEQVKIGTVQYKNVSHAVALGENVDNMPVMAANVRSWWSK